MPSTYKTQATFLIAALLVATGAVFLIFRPFLGALFLAAIVAIVFQPVHQRILSFCNGRATVAAVVSLFFVIITILIPISILGYMLLNDLQTFYDQLVTDGGLGGLRNLISLTEETINSFFPVNIDILTLLRQSIDWIAQNFGAIFTKIFSLSLSLFIMLLALFYFFKDGKLFTQQLITLSPLLNSQDIKILNRMEKAINTIIKGGLFIAILQGLMSSIGFVIFGIGSPILLGFMAGILALIPGVGPGLLFLVVSLYVLFTANWILALGLFLWGMVAVGLIDNILGPRLIGKGMKVHPLFILISVLGGIAFFGPIGFIAGPVILALLFTLLEIYPLIVEGRQPKKIPTPEK